MSKGIQNAITLICFTILAIVFQTWWIIIFAWFFWNNDDDEEGWIDDE